MRNKSDSIDTVVCSASIENAKKVFLEEKRWYSIRISSRMLHKLKYLAIYENRPVSAIRYIGKIKEVKLHDVSNNIKKYEILVDKPRRIKPIKMTEETSKLVPQSPRYTMKKLIDNGETLYDLFVMFCSIFP